MKAAYPMILGLLIVLCVWIVPAAGQAEVFKSHPLPRHKFTLGLEPEITLSGDTDFTFYLHAGYGLGRGYALQGKLGFAQSPFNDDDVHFSVMVDIPLIQGRGDPIGLFAALGASNWGEGAFESQLIMHFKLKPVILYTALDGAARFQDNAGGDDVVFPLEWVFGVEVPLRRQTNLLFETGIELNDSSSFVSGGVRFYF